MTPWAVARQASLSMGFPRQEHWSGLPFPSPGDIPDPGIKHGFSRLLADSLLSEPQGRHYLMTVMENNSYKLKGHNLGNHQALDLAKSVS